MNNYLIKKGNHYASGLHFGVHFGITEQKYKVRFSKECLYTPDWENDWNKLCGWSYGLHHNNSIRVCWRPAYTQIGDTEAWNRIELCIYVYEDGVRKTSLYTLTVNTEKDLIIDLQYWLKPNKIMLNVVGVQDYIYLNYNTKPSWGYRLYPYIGGDNIATQDTRIYLEKL